MGFDVSADVAGRQSQAAQAADEQMGKILTHPLFPVEDIGNVGIHRSGVFVVREVGEDAPHQALGAGKHWCSRRKGRSSIGPDRRGYGDKGAGKNKLESIQVGRAVVVG